MLFSSFLIPALVVSQPSRLVRDIDAGRPFNIYLPEGYDSTDERYPVMYFFRGHEDEWITRSQDASRRGDIRTVIDSLRANRSIGDAIYIFPWTPLPTAFPEDGFVAQTLIPHVDATYRTIPSRYARAIDGFSWGGLFSVAFILRYPQLIISAGAYDPSVSALPLSDYDSLRNDGSLVRWLRTLQLHITTAILGGSNNAGTLRMLDTLALYGVANTLPELVLDPVAQHNWFFADTHASRNIPRHWDIIGTPISNTEVTITGVQNTDIVSGTIPVTWSVASLDTTLRVFLQVSRDRGKTWREIASGASTDSLIQWDTSDEIDGTFYSIRAIAAGDTTYGQSSVAGIRVNNPGNAAPEVFFTGLEEHASMTGPALIRWVGGDAEGDPSVVSVDVSPDAGTSWSDIPGLYGLTDSVLWDTYQYPNSSEYIVRLKATDGVDSTNTYSPTVRVQNIRQALSGTLVERNHMHGDAEISVHIVDPTSIAGQQYRVFFTRVSTDPYHGATGPLVYDVANLTAGIGVLSGISVITGVEEGPAFDGLRLMIRDAAAIEFDESSSGWMNGTSNLTGTLLAPQVILPPDTFRGRPFPSDYVLRLSNEIIDTTFSRFGTAPTPVTWTVMNKLTNRKVLSEYLDVDASVSLTHADEIYFWEELDHRTGGGTDTVLTWQLVFFSPATLFPPQPGDSMFLAVTSPIHSGDVFEFDAVLTYVSQDDPFPQIPELYPAYPNPFNPTTTLSFGIPIAGHVTVTVFNIIGQQVATLASREFDAGVHTLRWDGSHFPTGIYFVRAETGHHHLYRKIVLLR